MPVRRGLSDDTGVKVRRKVAVVAGKSKGSRDGIRNLGPKGSDVEKARRKVILATGGSKGLSGYVKTAESMKRGVKKVQGRGNDSFVVSFGDVNENLSGKKSFSRKDLEAKNGNTRFKSISDGKLKRIKKNSSGTGALKTSEKERDPLPRKKGLSQNKYAVGSIGKTGKTGNGALKTSEKERDPLISKKGLSQDKYAVGSVEKARKKIVPGKRDLARASDLREDPPKKKKRVIRIDPNDTSNKRLDDNTSNNGISHMKKDLEDNVDAEMSRNAQFRAIRPSASILSFVEDNLLGRRRDIEFRRAGYNTELSAPLDNIPFSTSSERERIEVPVFRNKLEFFAAAKVSSSFPPPDLPEIAFAGRSNVGKSSLLNSLTRQWGVVRTSDKPGLTQTINFFKLGSKLSLVDLPGYGFAYAKDAVKEAWEELVKEYVSTRVGLKRVCLLVDTKWGMKPRDHELVDLMERSETKYQIVLTKTDLVFPIDVARRAMQIEENLRAKKSAVQPLMMVSSKTGAGIRSLRTVLANVARLARR